MKQTTQIFLYVMFLAIGTVNECLAAVNLHPIVLDIIYNIGFIVLSFFAANPPFWIWKKGWYIVLFVSVVSLILQAFNISPKEVSETAGLCCGIIWMLSLVYTSRKTEKIY